MERTISITNCKLQILQFDLSAIFVRKNIPKILRGSSSYLFKMLFGICPVPLDSVGARFHGFICCTIDNFFFMYTVLNWNLCTQVKWLYLEKILFIEIISVIDDFFAYCVQKYIEKIMIKKKHFYPISLRFLYDVQPSV